MRTRGGLILDTGVVSKGRMWKAIWGHEPNKVTYAQQNIAIVGLLRMYL